MNKIKTQMVRILIKLGVDHDVEGVSISKMTKYVVKLVIHNILVYQYMCIWYTVKDPVTQFIYGFIL
jgi:hypothetical protein